MDHDGDEAIFEKLKVIDKDLTDHDLDSSKNRIIIKMKHQRLKHIIDLPGCGQWLPVAKDIIPKDYTTVRDFLIQNASENASLNGQKIIDLKRVTNLVVTLIPDRLTTHLKLFNWSWENRQTKLFQMPLLQPATVTMENRFGVSLRGANEFIKNMTTTRKRGELVRTRIQYVAASQLETQQVEPYLWKILCNKEILQRIGTLSYLRPISAQWESLFKTMRDKKVLHPWIEWGLSASFWRYATASPRINIKASTPKAKKICVMSNWHRMVLYVAIQKLITPRGDIFNFASKDFQQQLASVKTQQQMEQLVDRLSEERVFIFILVTM